MDTEMALNTRTALGPVCRLATVLTVGVLAGMASIAVAPAAAADDESSLSTQVDGDDTRDVEVDDDDDDKDGPASVVERRGSRGPDAFIVFQHGRKPVFFCDEGKSRKQHKRCVTVTGSTRF